MIEVEIKLPVDIEIVRHNLMDIGFCFKDEVEEKDIYFNNDSRNLADRGEALRIRSQKNITTEKEYSFVTFKGKKLDSMTMTRNELETEISDSIIMERLFNSIGFYTVDAVCKRRRNYVYDDVTACLDSVEGLGDFLELEILVESDGFYDEAISRISDILNRLGYSIQDTVTNSYLSMLQNRED